VKRESHVLLIGSLVVGSVVLGIGWFKHRHGDAARVGACGAGAPAYWYDPMRPTQHFDKPGKSPFMDMQLVPVFAGEGASSGVKIDPGLQQNLGIRYATARRVDVATSFEAVRTTQFDESLADVVQSRVTGYIDRLYANAPMQRVPKGAPIASLFVPDWLAPQEEYLALRRGHVISRTEIEDHIYDGQVDPMSNVVDSAICSLRKKLVSVSEAPLIHTRRGLGYVLDAIEPVSGPR